MKKHHQYTILGFQALRRAAVKAAENARKSNCKIPFWKDGKIDYETPSSGSEPPGVPGTNNPRVEMHP